MLSCIPNTAGIFSLASLIVGDTVRRIIDGNPSLCMSISEDAVNATGDAESQLDYPDCPASVDIAVTMTFVYALFMVGA